MVLCSILDHLGLHALSLRQVDGQRMDYTANEATHPDYVTVHACPTQITWIHLLVEIKGKGKGSCLESRLHGNACSTDFTFPLTM